MAGTTASRGYPYPTDGDAQNTAVHIENLADAVDVDANFLDDKIDAESATRAAADTALQTNIDNVIHFGDTTNHLLVQGSLGEAVTDAFGKTEFVFPIPFSGPPLVIVNNATYDQQVVVGVENTAVTASQCVVFANNISDGLPAEDTNIAFHWVAFGFRS